MDEFRALVKEWQARTHTSQAELGRATTISQNVISRWLGRYPTRPTPANLEKLAPVLGLPYEELLRMCGYLPGAPMEKIDAQRQARHAELDRWLADVGPEYEADYWQALKANHETNLRIFRLRTAVSTPPDPAVSASVSARSARGRKPQKPDNSPLGASKRQLIKQLAEAA